MIQFLDDFTKFDKKVSNKEFITNRIDKTIFFKTNIFVLVKFIDTEYDKLNEGIYCSKCYQTQQDCICSQKELKDYNNNYLSNESDDDIIDLDLNEDIELKPSKIQVNYFVDEEDSKDNKKNLKDNKIIRIKKKPKLNNDGKNECLTIMMDRRKK